ARRFAPVSYRYGMTFFHATCKNIKGYRQDLTPVWRFLPPFFWISPARNTRLPLLRRLHGTFPARQKRQHAPVAKERPSNKKRKGSPFLSSHWQPFLLCLAFNLPRPAASARSAAQRF